MAAAGHTTARAACGIGGRYVIDSILGRGGMADVYAATDRRLGRRVAVKWLRTPTVDPAAHERIEAEARVLAGLDHPGLVKLLDAGVEDGRAFMVMELAGSTTLADRSRLGVIPAPYVAQVGAQLAGTLAYIHDRLLVHRDVKPSNVLLEEGDPGAVVVWLADFGIARQLDAAGVTGTGVTVGTAAYLSPEQVRGEPVTGASDVWALGLVLLECLTGRREYDGAPVEAALARLSRRPNIGEGLPDGWFVLLDRMLDPDPGRRPSAGQAADRLAALAAPVPSPGPEPTHVLDLGWAPLAAPATIQVVVPTQALPAPAAGRAPRRSARAPRRVALTVVLAGALLLGFGLLRGAGARSEVTGGLGPAVVPGSALFGLSPAANGTPHAQPPSSRPAVTSSAVRTSQAGHGGPPAAGRATGNGRGAGAHRSHGGGHGHGHGGHGHGGHG